MMEREIGKLVSLLNDKSVYRNSESQSTMLRIKEYFKYELTERDLDFSLSVLFRHEHSLLHFIREGCCDKTLKGGIKDSLCLITDLLNKYTKELVQYFVPIKNICFIIVTQNCGADILKYSYDIMKNIINRKESISIKTDLDIEGLVNFLHGRGLTDRNISSLALQGVYELYGVIVCKFPEYCSESRINSLLRSILQKLNDQMRKTNHVVPSVIEGCMNALDGVLCSPQHERDSEKFRKVKEDIYPYIKDACVFREDANRRAYQRAALGVFASHISDLWDSVLTHNDVQFWLTNLLKWSARNLVEDRVAGIKALLELNKQAIKHLGTYPQDSMKNVFMEHYRKTLTNPKAASYEIDVAIEGVSSLASLSGNEDGQDDMLFVFRMIQQRALCEYLEGNAEDRVNRLAKYLECQSNISTKLRSVSNEQLIEVTRLWRSVIECYPNHYPPVQVKVVQSLRASLVKMAVSESVLDKFLYNAVYQAVIITCSHTLLEEAELQEELTGDRVVTYRNYLKLWDGLFDVAYESRGNVNESGVLTPELRMKLVKKLCDCFVKSLITILDKLNVGYKRNDALEEVKSDPESSLKSDNPQDHRVLCNLANLYRDILAKPNDSRDKLVHRSQAELVTSVINQSVRFPLVSAFYKLLAAILKVAQRANYNHHDESEEQQSLDHYVLRFLEDVMLRCHQYKNDLQASCLLVVISAPIHLIKKLLATIAPVMQMIFQLGQNLIPLAHHGMDALELWQRELSSDELRPVLNLVLPLFDPYLRSRGITTELPEEEGMQMSKRQQKQERRIQEASQLSELQRRMLRLLGRLDSATCLALLQRPTNVTAWSTEPTFTFKIPFPDQRFNVHFDPLLPRVVELALASSDRQTKAAACELLHALVLIFIGNGRSMRGIKEPELVRVLVRLVPTLLRLSCGGDLVARQLFNPLTLQLMHWFTHPDMLRATAPIQTQAVLDAVWDGITDERDTALQDFSALCLQEFVTWSIKQSSVESMKKTPVGPKAVIRQINRLCLHPSISKRRGAALAFSNIAKKVREELSLVDRFWLELLYHLVCNLELGECHNHPALHALSLVEKVITAQAHLFSQESDLRRVPGELGSGRLRDVLKFLLHKCGSKTIICAFECRRLFLKLTPLVEGQPLPAELEDMVQVCEGAGNGSTLPNQPSMSDADHLRASLDCYAWSIKNGFISPAVAVKVPSTSNSRLVACVEYFINLLDLTVVPTVFCTREDSVLVKAKFDLVVALFDFIAVVNEEIKLLPFNFFNTGFRKLLSVSLFSPCKIGLDWRNQDLYDSLDNKLRLLLSTLRDHLSKDTLKDVYSELSSLVLYDCADCVKRLSLLCQDLQQVELKDKQYVNGLINLHKTDMLRHVTYGLSWDGNGLLHGVFSSFFNSEGVPLHPKASVISFADQLLHLAIILGTEVKTTLDCVMDTSSVCPSQTPTSETVTKGKYFMKLFEHRLITHLLQDPTLSVTRLLAQPSASNMDIVLQMLDASKYTKVKFSKTAEALVTALSTAWASLELWSGSKTWLVALVQALVLVLPQSKSNFSAGFLGPVSAWLFRKIKDPEVWLDAKADLVEMLSSVVGAGTNFQLEEALRHLQAQFPVSTKELKEGSVERNAFVSVYMALLHVMEATGSVSVLAVVCESAADKEHACADTIQAALVNLMNKHNNEVQMQVLRMVHDKFLDETKDEDFRLGLISRFLVVMLSNASKPVVIEFYADRIQNIINVMEERLRVHDQGWKSKQQLINKIGAFRLMEPIYLHLEKTDLENCEHEVTKAALPCIPGNDKRFNKYLATTLHKIRIDKCPREEMKDLFRRYQCAAFNALALFLCNTNQKMDFFSIFLFKESVWLKSIVPAEPKYTFPIDFDDYPKMKKQLVQMRSLVCSGEEGGARAANQLPVVYLPSQSLFNSSLQEDITSYDFSVYHVRDDDRMQQILNKSDDAPSVAIFELEDDCLNNHECMSTLISVVKYLCKKFPRPEGQNAQLPQWMEYLRALLTAEDQPSNCRAFIVKLVLNCEDLFKPYARSWISPIIKSVLDNCVGDRVNYLVHDIVRMFCNWHSAGKHDFKTEDKLNASEFLRRLVLNTPSERINVMKYNIEIIKRLVEMWGSFLSVPYQEVLDLMTPLPTSQGVGRGSSVINAGILLADVFLAQNILPFNQTGKSVFYDHLLKHLQMPDAKTYRCSAAVIGKILRIVNDSKPLLGVDMEFFNQVVEVIQPKIGEKIHEHFISCLYEIQNFYHPIVKGFEAQCISLLSYPADVGVKLVDILTTALDFPEFQNDAFSMLTDLSSILTNEGNPDKQLAALKLTEKLIKCVTQEEMSQLLPPVVALRKHKRAVVRASVYDIVSWVYDNNRHLEDDSAEFNAKKAKSVLIDGLADPDKKLQDKYYSFWSSRLPSEGWNRLVDILNVLYSPSCEAVFLPVITSLLLELCQKTDEYKRYIFDNPLSSCVYEKYTPSGSYRTQHAAFVPMFTDTLAGQISSLSLGSFSLNFELRATQPTSSMYSATLQSTVSDTNSRDPNSSFPGPSTSNASFALKYKESSSLDSGNLVDNNTTDGAEYKSPPLKLGRQRLIRDQQKVSRSFAERNRAKAAKVRHYKVERQRRREGEVTLTREYRKGDLPDIQIPCSEVVTALVSLAKRDQQIARQLLVAVYKALVDTGVNSNVSGVCSALNNILQTSTKHEPPLMATVLEMGLVQPSSCTSAGNITQVCKNSYQMSIGALLVEAKLMTWEIQPPANKRMRRNHCQAHYDDWTYLAEIYHSLEEKDVVQGLFEDKIAEACNTLVREALQAEDQERWKLARNKYTDCIAPQKGTAVENLLYEASFKCSAHLSDWKYLNKTLKEGQLENNLEEIWTDNWNSDHLLPWLFLSEIHCSEKTREQILSEDFDSALKCWLHDLDRKKHIESKVSEMLSVVHVLKGDSPRAKVTCDTSVQEFLSAWQHCDTLNNHLRGSRLLGVHRLMDTDSFLGLPPISDVHWSKKVHRLLEEWKRSSPSKMDNLVSWQTQAVYRNIFMRTIDKEAKINGSKIKNLNHSMMDNYLKTLECALKQKNFYVAKEYHTIITNKKSKELNSDMGLSKSKVCLLSALLNRDSTPMKVESILKVWEPLENLREREARGVLEYPLSRDLHLHTAEVYRALLAVVRNRPSVMDNLSPCSVEKLAQLGLREDTCARLKQEVVSSMERAVAVTESRSPLQCQVLADAYLRLSVFCHEICSDDAEYRGKLIQSLLRAMRYGSSEARILFPCLLDPSLADHADLFKFESESVPEWMFLSWVAQLLAHLDTDIGQVVAPLVLQLANAYPIALQLPFHLSKEMYQCRHPGTRATVDLLSEKLRMDHTTSDLMRALACVCQPHNCLLYHINQLKTAITQEFGRDAIKAAYDTMKNEAFPPHGNDIIKGKAFDSLKIFTEKLESVYGQYHSNTISTSDFLEALNTIIPKVKSCKDEKSIELANLSPWLIRGYKGGVELPGQYTGESRPLPNHHVTIAAFHENVMHLRSIRRPMKITILGSDAKSYPFLVKFGEDLRQDQRIQQLFRLMNQLLITDVTTSRRQLSVQTYNVVPLNNRLGIIQWVDNTTTLGHFMIKKDLSGKVQAAQKIYHTNYFARCDTKDMASISRFYQTVKKEESVPIYLSAVNELPAHMMRDAVLKMSTGPEAFFHLRTVILSDHSCLSMCHWLLGIGDRHLENTLVCMDSGRLLGIDFGHAFGTATQFICVPELMPLRLTPQILNLAAPFGTTGLIKETMVNTLRVLRENSRLLLATMAVFMLEPTVDWVKAARRHEAYSSESGDWFPQQKITLASRKLGGCHPRKVMQEDLQMGHGEKPHYNKLVELLLDECDLRDAEKLSPRQQVDCLIAHATNQHILSKTFSGWAPWI